ncbi:sigma-54 interaction domain-containing protein [Dictyobacter aurantiacus]|uniref:Sigma-54 factor interaction domain-containing protein n=1 Tax=Dictyobacter aurantiacus TaxID=1936993 RepID=A0A401ZAB7_9CHLR|nr:sigma-54 dependent transcriptional regulator [Dictyobacter aurantiacus]GCE03807.1 hypothetical protein KDAU_11360 [Dictyobacter aurantiacus]
MDEFSSEKGLVAQSVTTLQPDDPIEGMIIGKSAAIQQVIAAARKIASHATATVLIQGESGTGKDVLARAIHELGRTTTSPGSLFIPINCAAIPETLLESELFGVEAGAYTDAKVSRDGWLSRAHRGTLFLDEIGSMPLFLQAKLLRVLETRSFRRVGGMKEIHVNLRIISATNTDLQAAVARKAFRQDLFYRLNGFPIYMPPLRERREDLPLLIEHFLRRVSANRGEPLTVSPDAMRLMESYSWPGNVRELLNAIERGDILCDNNVIQPKDILSSLPVTPQYADQQLIELLSKLQFPENGLDLPALLSTIERSFIQEALKRCGGNQVHAAQLLSLSRDQLRYRLLEKAVRQLTD